MISNKNSRLISLTAWGILGFLLLPSLVVIPLSFGGVSRELVFPPRTFSLGLYREYFAGSAWLGPTWLSMRVAAWTTFISLVLGVPAAYGLARGRFRGQRLVMLFLLSPIMVPSVVVALGLYIYFIQTGISQGELRLILGLTVVSMPFLIVTTTAGLQDIDPNLERAAMICGANSLTILFRVVLPQLKGALFGGALFAFLISFDEVVVAWFVTQPGYVTLPIKMFSSIQWEISPVLAAVSSMLTLLSATICILGVLLRRGKRKA